MNKRILKVIVGIVLAFNAQHAVYATTNDPNLVDIFNQALQNDPQWLAYKSTLLSQKENIPIAMSLLLPTISIGGPNGNASSQYNFRNNRAPIPNAFPANRGVGQFNYWVNNYGINLSENIINFADWANFEGAKASVKADTAQYGANYQQLIITVAQAYFNVLQARDNLVYTITERQAVNQLYEQNLERYRVGLGTITDVYNAKAQLDNIISTEIGAKNNLLNTLEALRAITGQTYTSLAGVKDNIPLMTPAPKNVEDWIKIALDQNLSILAARYSADAAKEVILQQFSGNLPTVTGIASYNELHAGFNGSTFVNEGDVAAGAQIAVPIYSGGGVVAATRQAQFNYQTALSNLGVTTRTTAETTRQNYNNVISFAAQIQSDKQAIISNQSSLESMIAAFQVGTRTMIDVLNAQTSLYQAQTNYSQDLYSYIINILLLKQSAGTLSPQDVAAINSWLTVAAPLNHVEGTAYDLNVPALQVAPPTINTSFSSPTLSQQQQQMQQSVKSLPVLTPQPQTQWTQPVPTTAPTVTAPATTTAPSSSTAPSSNTQGGALNSPYNGAVSAPDPSM